MCWNAAHLEASSTRTWNEGSKKRVLERSLRQAVEIDKMQFVFRPGTGTTQDSYKRDIEENTGNCGGHL